jgi:hypothetical protein
MSVVNGEVFENWDDVEELRWWSMKYLRIYGMKNLGKKRIHKLELYKY